MEEYALLSLFRPPLTTWVVEQVRVGTYHMLNREGTELRRFSNSVESTGVQPFSYINSSVIKQKNQQWLQSRPQSSVGVPPLREVSLGFVHARRVPVYACKEQQRAPKQPLRHRAIIAPRLQVNQVLKQSHDVLLEEVNNKDVPESAFYRVQAERGSPRHLNCYLQLCFCTTRVPPLYEPVYGNQLMQTLEHRHDLPFMFQV